MGEPKTNQLNIRVDRRLEKAIDAKRIEMAERIGYIPSRSEVVRLALDAFLASKPGVVSDRGGESESSA
jgi:hypothetical protein